nr:GGDEF domain-containing protein [Neoroseomonas eburnea]
MIAALLLLLRLIILTTALAVAAVTLRAGSKWRHDRRRFGLCLLGGVATIIVALRTLVALAGTAPADWSDWLQLLPDATLPVLLLALLGSMRRQEAARRSAAATAPINPDTGLPNRPALLHQVMPAVARCRREAVPCSVITAALDGTAEIEAARGPAVAADLLRDFATVFRQAMRAGDLPGHVRGEVLGALLPGASAEAAGALAARLREEASARLPHPAMDGRILTVSVGVALVGGGPVSAALDEAFAGSESALAAARASGGDSVMTADPPPPRSAALA